MSVHELPFSTLLEAEDAAFVVVEAESKLSQLDLYKDFANTVMSGIQKAVQRRKLAGFETNPLDSDEVDGIVKAAMGNNDQVFGEGICRVALQEYTIGYLQTTDDALQTARSIHEELQGGDYGHSN